jgi:hypothetical protein
MSDMHSEAKLQKFAEIAAGKIFNLRGGHSEVHLSRPELSSLLFTVLLAVPGLLDQREECNNPKGFFTVDDLVRAGHMPSSKAREGSKTSQT